MAGVAKGLLVVAVVGATCSQIDDVVDNFARHKKALGEAMPAEGLLGENLATITLTSSAALPLVLM